MKFGWINRVVLLTYYCACAAGLGSLSTTTDALLEGRVSEIVVEARQNRHKISEKWRHKNLTWVKTDPTPLLLQVINKVEGLVTKVRKEADDWKKPEDTYCGNFCVLTLVIDTLEVAGAMVGYQCKPFALVMFWLFGILTLTGEQHLSLPEAFLVLGQMWTSVGYGSHTPDENDAGLKLWHGFHSWVGVLFVDPQMAEATTQMVWQLETLLAQAFDHHGTLPSDWDTTLEDFAAFDRKNVLYWKYDREGEVKAMHTEVMGSSKPYERTQPFKDCSERDDECLCQGALQGQQEGQGFVAAIGKAKKCSGFWSRFLDAQPTSYLKRSNTQARRLSSVIIMVVEVTLASVTYAADLALGDLRGSFDTNTQLYKELKWAWNDLGNSTQNATVRNYLSTFSRFNATVRNYLSNFSTFNESFLKNTTTASKKKNASFLAWNNFKDRISAVCQKENCNVSWNGLVTDLKKTSTTELQARAFKLFKDDILTEDKSFKDRYRDNLQDAFYMIMMTFSTVGYGDKSPASWWGQLLSPLVMQGGVAAFNFFSARANAPTADEKSFRKTLGLEGGQPFETHVLTGENREALDDYVPEKHPKTLKDSLTHWMFSCVDITHFPETMKTYFTRNTATPDTGAANPDTNPVSQLIPGFDILKSSLYGG